MTTEELQQAPASEPEQAARLRTARRRLPDGPADEPAPLETTELSFAQERLWFLDQMTPGNPAYNILRAQRLHGPLDAARLEQSLAAVVARHASLRTRLASEGGRPQQVVAEALPVRLAVEQAGALSADEREARVAAFVAEASQHAFDLA
ncbi:MAG: condensation domain-containing protein, partial [Anaerolineales bacterium]